MGSSTTADAEVLCQRFGWKIDPTGAAGAFIAKGGEKFMLPVNDVYELALLVRACTPLPANAEVVMVPPPAGRLVHPEDYEAAMWRWSQLTDSPTPETAAEVSDLTDRISEYEESAFWPKGSTVCLWCNNSPTGCALCGGAE